MYRWIASAVCLYACLLATGCGAYHVQGRVVRGPVSSVEFVAASDPRLNDVGVANANVDVIRDPKSLGRETVAALRSDASGDFVLRLDSVGAGWMDEEWRIRCYSVGYANADRVLRLPTAGDQVRLLITLATGRTEIPVEEDLWREFRNNR